MQIVFSHGGTDLIKSWKNNFSMATNVFDQDRKRWKFLGFSAATNQKRLKDRFNGDFNFK
jgi:hypothetical protein